MSGDRTDWLPRRCLGLPAYLWLRRLPVSERFFEDVEVCEKYETPGVAITEYQVTTARRSMSFFSREP
jgi:hypothetical protein